MKEKWLIGTGLVVIVFTSLADIIMGKGETIFGPKSFLFFAVGIMLVVAGMVFLKKKTN